MRVDNIGRTSPPEQLTYPLTVVLAQWFDADTRQHAREIGLPAAITPDLTNNRRTRPQLACPAAGARAAGHLPDDHDGQWRQAPRRRVPPSRNIRARRQAEPRCGCVEFSLGKGTVFRLPRIQSGTEQLVPEPVGRRLTEPCRHAGPLPRCGLADAFAQFGRHRHGESIHLRHAYDNITYGGIHSPREPLGAISY